MQTGDLPPCINHGDLQVANLIGNPPVFLDWEYAQIAAPTWDLACLLTYYPALQAWQPDLLAASGLFRPGDLELLGLHKQLFACLTPGALANNMALATTISSVAATSALRMTSKVTGSRTPISARHRQSRHLRSYRLRRAYAGVHP